MSATAAAPSVRKGRAFRSAHIVAVIAWLIGLWTTTEFIGGLGVGTGWTIVISLAIQVILTRIETQVWAGKANPWAWGAFSIDIAINAGGIWPYTQNFWSTPTGNMLNDIAFRSTGYAISNMSIEFGIVISLAAIISGIITIIFSAVIAYAPEGIWNAG